MKKFYTSVVSVLCFFFITSSSQAQFLGGTYTMLPTGGSTSNPANWVGGIPPGNPCLNCHIILNGPVTMDFHDAIMNINTPFAKSQLDISAGSVVDINEYVELNNTTVIIANNATVNINDEVHLINTSITLNNTGSVINGNNDIHNPSHGTVDPGDPAGAGIYYNYTGTLPLTAAGPYDFLISPFGYGNPFGGPSTMFDPYTINCNAIAPPPVCATGFVFGPATTAFSITDNTWEFVQSTPLPVILTKFAAILNPDKSVGISWTTSEEINSDYYDVERSPDASKWISLGHVKAKGSSAVDVNYSYRDPSPNPGINYYRLKMVDLDGKFGFSKIASVNLNGGGPKLVIYSNPFTDAIRLKVNLDSQDQLALNLTDATGKVYSRQIFNGQAGDNYINIYPTGASAGMYILNMNGNTISQTIKLIKQ